MTSPRWLAVHRHRIRGFNAPFLLVLQHHLVDSPTRIAAPVVPAPRGAPTLLAPCLTIGGDPFRAMLLDMAAVPVRSLLEEVEQTGVEGDSITSGLDAIFRGYPVGLSLD